MNKTSTHIKWQPLLLGGVLAVFISLGIHSVMLDQMHIPYPTRYLKSTWLRLPDLVLMTFGVFYLCDWLPEAFRSTRVRIALLLCVLLPAYKELFLRQPLMQMAVTNTWNAYPFLDQLPKVLPFILLLASVAGIAERVRTVPPRLVCSVILAAVFYIGLQPVLVHAYAPIKSWTNAREGELVFAPDSVYIDSWAYLTFVEPVIAAFVIAWLTWERFPGQLKQRFWILAVLLFVLRSSTFGWLLNPAIDPSHPIMAMLSAGQFTLEAMCLALLVSGTWLRATRIARIPGA